MKIVLAYNEKHSKAEAEAEFDSIETIQYLSSLIRELGHEVAPIDVGSVSIGDLINNLTKMKPDLVFNMVEGSRGTFREAFYPALFDQLGIPYTGSSPVVLGLCLDKEITKRVVVSADVPAPRDNKGPLVIIKPRYEGSSKGITSTSVVKFRSEEMTSILAQTLVKYPDGVMIEEFIEGIDVSVGWIDGIGFLPSIGFAFETNDKHPVMDFGMKSNSIIRPIVPAPLTPESNEQLMLLAERAFTALNIKGYGRADFRVAPDGRVWFLEMNPLPTLAPTDPELYVAAKRLGKSPSDVIECIIASAVKRRM